MLNLIWRLSLQSHRTERWRENSSFSWSVSPAVVYCHALGFQLHKDQPHTLVVFDGLQMSGKKKQQVSSPPRRCPNFGDLCFRRYQKLLGIISSNSGFCLGKIFYTVWHFFCNSKCLQAPEGESRAGKCSWTARERFPELLGVSPIAIPLSSELNRLHRGKIRPTAPTLAVCPHSRGTSGTCIKLQVVQTHLSSAVRTSWPSRL